MMESHEIHFVRDRIASGDISPSTIFGHTDMFCLQESYKSQYFPKQKQHNWVELYLNSGNPTGSLT